MLKRVWWMLPALVLGIGHASYATTLVVDGSGQLLGANGVLVGTTLYDVRFVDGSCISVFDLCNGLSDLPFSNAADADAASASLLSQVLIDGPDGSFDSTPSLVTGCLASDLCDAYSPYAFSGVVQVQVSAAHNYAIGVGTDLVHGGIFPKGTDTSSDPRSVFVRWTVAAPVPERGSLLLVAAAVWLACIRLAQRQH